VNPAKEPQKELPKEPAKEPAKEPPRPRTCTDCVGGFMPARRYLNACVQILFIAGSDALDGRRRHPFFDFLGQVIAFPDGPADQDLVDLVDGLSDEGGTPAGAEGTVRTRIARKIIRSAGMDPDRWGMCPTCGGNVVLGGK